MSGEKLDLEKGLSGGSLTNLERQLIDEYLLSKGYRMVDLHSLPKEEAKALMREACLDAALKLAEIEARVKFRKEIEASD